MSKRLLDFVSPATSTKGEPKMRAIACIRWQCTTCQSFHLSEPAAEGCCVCVEPGCGSEVATRSLRMCVVHAKCAVDASEARRVAGMTFVEDDGGLVYDDTRDSYHDDIAAWLDAIWDYLDEGDVEALGEHEALLKAVNKSVVVLVDVTKTVTPDLADFVSEAWGQGVDEWGGLSDQAEKCLEEAQCAVEGLAPTQWRPTTERVQLLQDPSVAKFIAEVVRGGD